MKEFIYSKEWAIQVMHIFIAFLFADSKFVPQRTYPQFSFFNERFYLV